MLYTVDHQDSNLRLHNDSWLSGHEIVTMTIQLPQPLNVDISRPYNNVTNYRQLPPFCVPDHLLLLLSFPLKGQNSSQQRPLSSLSCAIVKPPSVLCATPLQTNYFLPSWRKVFRMVEWKVLL
ncbi:hypothetical protein TNCV_1229871 [Trichonephila clavipes]|nr:hypothetical protein TNCV_1229871 [Trichonephila clavipes]